MSERQVALDSVREEISRSIAEEKRAIHAQADEARAALADDARRIAAEIGAQILHRPISDHVVTRVGSGA
jgi:hypothetical protein